MEASSLALNPLLSSHSLLDEMPDAQQSHGGWFILADDPAVEAPEFPAKIVLKWCSTDKAELCNFIYFSVFSADSKAHAFVLEIRFLFYFGSSLP